MSVSVLVVKTYLSGDSRLGRLKMGDRKKKSVATWWLAESEERGMIVC